jgi:hypothetical protein
LRNFQNDFPNSVSITEEVKGAVELGKGHKAMYRSGHSLLRKCAQSIDEGCAGRSRTAHNRRSRPEEPKQVKIDLTTYVPAAADYAPPLCHRGCNLSPEVGRTCRLYTDIGTVRHKVTNPSGELRDCTIINYQIRTEG